MVNAMQRLKAVLLLSLILSLPMLSAFFILFFSLQRYGVGMDYRKWLYLLLIFLVLTASFDMRCRKNAAQREEASNVQTNA
ncbi:MAG: hypothetical protein Q8S19_08735 [Bacillota bacterium]|nr:hypothetical protein [Bacillota bacterium]